MLPWFFREKTSESLEGRFLQQDPNAFSTQRSPHSVPEWTELTVALQTVRYLEEPAEMLGTSLAIALIFSICSVLSTCSAHPTAPVEIRALGLALT